MSEIQRPLTTPRLTLEPLEVSHAHPLYASLQAPELYRFIPRDAPPSVEALAARYSNLATRHSPGGEDLWLNWVMRKRDTGEYVGTVEVTVCPTREAYLAYQVFPLFWKQGFATEACQRVLEHLVADYSVTRVIAEIDTRNEASIRMVERLGFTRVAMTPQADYFKGSYSDEYRYEWTLPPKAVNGESAQPL